MNCKCDETSSSTSTTPATGGCQPTAQTCMPTLLTPQAEQSLRGATRQTTLALAGVGGLAAGASATNAVDFNSQTPLMIPWVLVIDDFVAALASNNLDTLEIFVKLNGVTRLDIFGGRFGRNNASCVTACGLAVCVGPMDTVTVVVKNISAAALNATDAATLQYHPIFPGEPGFDKVCGAGSACAQPQAPTASFNAVEVG
jgi:hypothetical protein